MRSGVSFLTTSDVETVALAKRDMLATRIARAPFTLVVHRPHPQSGHPSQRPPQIVWVKVETTTNVPYSAGAETAAANLVRGRLQKESPLDIQVGDRFQLPEGWIATVTVVDTDEASGITTALFTANTGYGQ